MKIPKDYLGRTLWEVKTISGVSLIIILVACTFKLEWLFNIMSGLVIGWAAIRLLTIKL